MPYHKSFKGTLYNKEWLYRVYVTENRNATQVGELIGCDKSAVLNWLRKLDIAVKNASEAQKLAPHLGSHSPRPRNKFRGTLHNPEWMAARAHLNASEIARDAGCSVPAAQEAMGKAGIAVPGISEAKADRPAPHKRKAEGQTISRTSSHRRANENCPSGPCKICGQVPENSEVNHIDRDWQNNSPDNLEKLCGPCHRQQHALETKVMIQMLKDLGIPYREIWQRARNLALSGERTSSNLPSGLLEVKGETRSVQAWARTTGLGEATIRKRIAAGWVPERAVTEPVYADKLLTFEGVEGTIADHARRKGIAVGNVYSRLKQGWSLERAFGTPIRPLIRSE